MDERRFLLSTPREINDKVKEFCDGISLENKPFYVDIILHEKSMPGNCFQNVDFYISKFGGKKAVGWKIWRCKNIYLQAESHAIVEDETGNMFDVSPHDGGDQALFLYDEQLQALKSPIASQYFGLSESVLVRNFIEFKKEIENIEHFRDEAFVPDDSVLEKYAAFAMAFARPRNKNEFCSCESNLKYKNCCGKYI